MFVNPAMAARLWFLVAAAAVVLSIVQPYLLVRAYRTRERVVVLDGSGTFHISPLLAFEESAKLHEQHALLACLALLQRNPAGFDQPELLEKLFLPEALQQAQSDWTRSAEEFSRKKLHQKVEVLKLTVLETREQVVLVQAEGQLLRTGSVGQQIFTEAPAFTARFTFARNPNLAANGRFPLAVWYYELSS
ncbi:hypothetical protein OH491_01520 [Termitidicoccus mucosus]|uniref:Uncharacterized protein n=1 Tax=Termitidicoccus mucosus TaxID=1184151 RepID=A0A178IM87_9BACT|nr:hypothetical protein AW736_08035 [Opitutaceae bacterium TSB47]